MKTMHTNFGKQRLVRWIMKSDIKNFTGILENSGDGMDTAFITIPFDVEKVYGTKGQVKVKATFDGHPYRGVIANMGTGCHIIGVKKDIRKAIEKAIGDRISVTIEKDTEERVVEMPEDLQSALLKSRKAKDFFDTLSYTNRKEYAVWVSSAKRQETREKRLAESIKKLLAGKKNPSA
jgi:hypothetical protein